MRLWPDRVSTGASSQRASPLLLLLNLSILVVTFFVSLGGAETQTRILRSTGRIAFAGAVPGPVDDRIGEDASAEARAGADGARRARLLRYLARVPGGSGLAPTQVRGLYEALDACCADLAMEEGLLRARSFDISGAASPLDKLPDRLARTAAASLRAAEIPEGALLEQLVRIVVSSAG